MSENCQKSHVQCKYCSLTLLLALTQGVYNVRLTTVPLSCSFDPNPTLIFLCGERHLVVATQRLTSVSHLYVSEPHITFNSSCFQAIYILYVKLSAMIIMLLLVIPVRSG